MDTRALVAICDTKISNISAVIQLRPVVSDLPKAILLSKLFYLNSAFLGLYLVALLFAVATAEPSGVMATYINQLSKVRLPMNLSLLLWLGGALVLKKPIGTILVITAMFNWILVIDDYFVVQIQNLTFESTLGQVLASLRPIVAASVTLIAIEVKLHERGSSS